MTRRRAAAIVVALFALGAAKGQDSLEIKGLRLGMPKGDAIDVLRASPRPFTIGGVPSKYRHLGPDLDFTDDKLDHVSFFFAARDFEQLVDSVRGKYPALACQDSAVGNVLGAMARQTICSVHVGDQTLTVARYATDFLTGHLTMTTQQRARQLREDIEHQKRDI